MDALTIVAMVIVFCLGFLAWYNLRILLRILSIGEMEPKDMYQSAFVGGCCSFLFYFFT